MRWKIHWDTRENVTLELLPLTVARSGDSHLP
jgi:hypothetical protein